MCVGDTKKRFSSGEDICLRTANEAEILRLGRSDCVKGIAN